MLVGSGDEGFDRQAELILAGEARAPQGFSSEQPEPYLNLIEPTR